jgi:hypothetical protein
MTVRENGIKKLTSPWFLVEGEPPPFKQAPTSDEIVRFLKEKLEETG